MVQTAESKHTPGPWKAVRNSCYWHIDAGDFGSIGDTCASSCSPEHGGSLALGEANARLIAAAPELLAACKELLTELREARDEGKYRRSRDSQIAGLAAVIAQAEGGAA